MRQIRFKGEQRYNFRRSRRILLPEPGSITNLHRLVSCELPHDREGVILPVTWGEVSFSPPLLVVIRVLINQAGAHLKSRFSKHDYLLFY